METIRRRPRRERRWTERTLNSPDTIIGIDITDATTAHVTIIAAGISIDHVITIVVDIIIGRGIITAATGKPSPSDEPAAGKLAFRVADPGQRNGREPGAKARKEPGIAGIQVTDFSAPAHQRDARRTRIVMNASKPGAGLKQLPTHT